MEQYEIKRPESFKKRKRIGCGTGSGHGKTSCRGQKGQMSRSGSKHRAWFEGGQMPLQRRIPKRGFNNIFKAEFQLINVSQLNKLNENVIDAETLLKAGLIKKSETQIKILGNGELTKSVKVIADVFSKSAQEKIVKAGGEAVIRTVELN
ncbi:MAG: 50S ribosomal protein L15 [Spirochaetae bacterium HGW-Spirochaetae-1]|jgi:large subunit ribosomal protein L15|nr:MAG: 50S ribosomal protein L15 [Spirochaetae bacterium HGW-Spirochaetae-1]